MSTLKVVSKKIEPPPALEIQGLKAVSINTFCPIGLFYGYIFKNIINYILLILSIASTVFSYEPNAVSLKYPSPLGPKPEPGVPSTLAFSRR